MTWKRKQHKWYQKYKVKDKRNLYTNEDGDLFIKRGRRYIQTYDAQTGTGLRRERQKSSRKRNLTSWEIFLIIIILLLLL